jgi:TetR/AcrR family transcriptional regulator of autoinduction and epiphytic fitness
VQALTEEKVDGRRERTKRTRAAIVLALTALLDEGRIEPVAAEIAERAGVAVRSIAQHFASREELLLAVAEHHASRLRRADAVDRASPFEERLARFVLARSRVLEASRAMRGAAQVVIARSPSVARALEAAAKGRREETRAVFATELARTDAREQVERAVALATSGRAWDAMRTELGLGTKTAREQMEWTVRGLLLSK